LLKLEDNSSTLVINSEQANTISLKSREKETIFLLKEIFMTNEYNNFIDSINYLLDRINMLEAKENENENRIILENSTYGLEKHLNISVNDIIPKIKNSITAVSDNKKLEEEVQYKKLAEETENASNRNNRNQNAVTKDIDKDNESRILKNLKVLIYKFDASGDVLFSLNNKYSDSYSKNDIDQFLNTFFSNLLVFGSYKLKTGIASSKEVAFKAGSVK